VRDSLADIERAKRAIGFAPRVELMEGLRRTVEFFRRGA
jgi:nucleoside-diphosphate-sugar epimerase